MKKIIYLLILIPIASYSNEDRYIVPQDVLDARDKAVNSFHDFQKKLGKRYLELSKKQDLTIQELQEFKALDLIVNEKDTSEYEKEWSKQHPNYKLKPIIKTKIISY